MDLLSVVKAILVRLAFAIHGTVMVIGLVWGTGIKYYWLALCLIFVSILETIITLKATKRGEWKWFLPSVFLYLLWVVPAIMILESHALDFRRAYVPLDTLNRQCPLTFERTCEEKRDLNFTPSADDDIREVKIPGQVLDSKGHEWARTFSLLMMQTMMLVLIAGRWLGPKGTLTRDQLSQLLLAYMGMAADMLEFATETLKMEETACDTVLVYFVLGAWSWSLLQFTLGLTATKQRKPRVVNTGPGLRHVEVEPHTGRCANVAYCCETEIWALMVSVIMQDGPYLVIRLYIMFKIKNFGQTMIFFTCKNGILFLLQMYRIYVVIIHRNDKDEDSDDDKSSAMKVIVKVRPSPARKGNGKKAAKKSPLLKKSPQMKNSPQTRKSPLLKKSPGLKKSPKLTKPIQAKKSPQMKKSPQLRGVAQLRRPPGMSPKDSDRFL